MTMRQMILGGLALLALGACDEPKPRHPPPDPMAPPPPAAVPGTASQLNIGPGVPK
jgi:hypothetical protein